MVDAGVRASCLGNTLDLEGSMLIAVTCVVTFATIDIHAMIVVTRYSAAPPRSLSNFNSYRLQSGRSLRHADKILHA